VAQEKLGKKNDDLIKAMDAFGGGLAGHGEVCGLVAGGLAVIGLLFGRAEGNKEADMKMWMFSREFLKRFRTEIAGGSLLCRDIVNVNWADMNQVLEYRKGEKRIKCRKLTGETARLIDELMERAAQ